MTLNDERISSQFGGAGDDTSFLYQVLVADSIKSPKHLHQQLSGITLKDGTVLILMDIAWSGKQILQVYRCLRKYYLLPVYIYISWGMNRWHSFLKRRSVPMRNL
jgi:hypothetical protein